MLSSRMPVFGALLFVSASVAACSTNAEGAAESEAAVNSTATAPSAGPLPHLDDFANAQLTADRESSEMYVFTNLVEEHDGVVTLPYRGGRLPAPAECGEGERSITYGKGAPRATFVAKDPAKQSLAQCQVSCPVGDDLAWKPVEGNAQLVSELVGKCVYTDDFASRERQTYTTALAREISKSPQLRVATGVAMYEGFPTAPCSLVLHDPATHRVLTIEGNKID